MTTGNTMNETIWDTGSDPRAMLAFLGERDWRSLVSVSLVIARAASARVGLDAEPRLARSRTLLQVIEAWIAGTADDDAVRAALDAMAKLTHSPNKVLEDVELVAWCVGILIFEGPGRGGPSSMADTFCGLYRTMECAAGRDRRQMHLDSHPILAGIIRAAMPWSRVEALPAAPSAAA